MNKRMIDVVSSTRMIDKKGVITGVMPQRVLVEG